MRKSILLMFLLLAAASMSAQQLGRPLFGARLSMELSAPAGSSNVYKLGSGFTVGGVAKLPLYSSFYFEPGLLFTFSAMNTKDLVTFDSDYYYEGSAKVYGLRVPLNIGYDFNLTPSMTLGVSTGPWLNINLSAKQGLQPNMAAPNPLPDRTVDMFHHGWKRVDALWGFSLSMTFSRHYYVGISGGVSFTPLASYGDKDKKIRIHRNTVAFTLGYNF